MEKQTIEIQKIKDGLFLERKDEVAIEQDFEIKLRSGEMIYGSCTPTHMDEMVLGSRYLADDLTEEEKTFYGLNNYNVSVEQIDNADIEKSGHGKYIQKKITLQ
jgi:formate dehydrogenase assembly factor FdhD